MIQELLRKGSEFKVDCLVEGEVARIRVNGKLVFAVTPDDVATLEGETQATLSEQVFSGFKWFCARRVSCVLAAIW